MSLQRRVLSEPDFLLSWPAVVPRQPFPEHLPRERVIEPTCMCANSCRWSRRSLTGTKGDPAGNDRKGEIRAGGKIGFCRHKTPFNQKAARHRAYSNFIAFSSSHARASVIERIHSAACTCRITPRF
jgi:hypothetical protein